VSSYFSTAARALATSLGNLFRRPVTVEFPKVIRPRAERYRASFALLHEEDGDEACIGCLQCERICPSQVIAIKAGGKRESPISGKKRGYADDFVLDLNACIYCELCVQVCPTDAIVMTREPELPAYGREDLVLTMAKLYANEKSKPRAWGDATRLNGMQVPPKPPAAAKPAAAPAQAAAPGSPTTPAAASAAPAGASASAASPAPASAGTASPAAPRSTGAASPASPAASANAPGSSASASAAAPAPAASPVIPASGPASSPAAPAAGPAPATGSGSDAPPASKTGEGES
jgi:NADH-quinone oxidoreductase subunit I